MSPETPEVIVVEGQARERRPDEGRPPDVLVVDANTPAEVRAELARVYKRAVLTAEDPPPAPQPDPAALIVPVAEFTPVPHVCSLEGCERATAFMPVLEMWDRQKRGGSVRYLRGSIKMDLTIALCDFHAQRATADDFTSIPALWKNITDKLPRGVRVQKHLSRLHLKKFNPPTKEATP